MKKMRKLLALLMVAVALLTVMAIPAAAYEDVMHEAIEEESCATGAHAWVDLGWLGPKSCVHGGTYCHILQCAVCGIGWLIEGTICRSCHVIPFL